MRVDNLLRKTISILFACLFFLVPLFFTSVNSELFEFNKIILVYLFTIIIVSVWAARMIWQRKIVFKRTFFDIPLALFLASQVASTIFSIDRHTSIFGYYSRFNGSLLSTLCFLLLYWAFVSNCEVKDVYKMIKVSFVSAAIVSIYGILEHFGHSFSCLLFTGSFNASCWIQKVQERVFATLGQPNWLAAYLVVLTPLSWWLALSSKFKMQSSKLKLKIQSYWPYLLFILLFSCTLFTQSRSGFLGLGLATVSFCLMIILTHKSQVKSLTKPLILNTFFLILPIVIFGSPFPQVNKLIYYKSFLTPTSLPSEARQFGGAGHPQPLPPSSEDGGISTSSDIRKIVWKGAIDIFKHYPLFGSGVETFAYSYYNFRPIEHNLVTEWDFLYNKAHNEYLNYLATTGSFGLGTYLLFILSFMVWSINSIKNQVLSIKEKNLTTYYLLLTTLFAGWLSILVTNFFGFSVVVTSLYFFLIPAFIITLNFQLPTSNLNNPASHLSPPTSRHTSRFSPLFLILLFAICFLLFAIINYWRADYFYARAQKQIKQNNYAESYRNLYTAKNLFAGEPVYLSELASVTANLALMSNSEQEASATAELSELAINYSDQARYISPKNLNILKSRVRVFYTLSLIKSGYLKNAIDSMYEAITLAPTDPKLVYNLGLLYAKTDDSKLTILTLEKAVQLKPNYIDARNALALFYEDAGKNEKALEQLQILLKLAPENVAEFQKQIDKLK